MQWFKYMESCWAADLAAGKLRICGLAFYDDLDGLGDAIADAKENSQQINSRFSGVSGADLNQFQRQMIDFAPGVDPRYIEFEGNWNVRQRYIAPPLYAFCASDVYDPGIGEKFSKANAAVERPAYDACVQIDDALKFVHLVALAMSELGWQYHGHGNCFYTGRDVQWESWNPDRQTCPGFRKEPHHAWQHEVRVIFRTNDRTPPPVCLSIPELASICRILYSN